MNEKINHPYASLFELVMSLPNEGKKLLQHFADPKLVKTLDLNTLAIAKGAYKGGKTGLSNLFTDTVYSCKCQDEEIFINLLFEHKSYLENPKAQILTYLMTAYNEQKLVWTNKRTALRVAGKKVPNEVFYHRPIIAILFYHGERKWQDYKFTDQFNLPKKWMFSYIPDVEIFVINMADFSDEDIEKIGASFLQPMLYMFKHKGDKNFLLQNIEKLSGAFSRP